MDRPADDAWLVSSQARSPARVQTSVLSHLPCLFLFFFPPCAVLTMRAPTPVPTTAVFISNADVTIVMATHAIIASKFMALESSSWLFSGFMLASTATQTTFGQLSEIFGRKPLIMVSYFVFGLGWYVIVSLSSLSATY